MSKTWGLILLNLVQCHMIYQIRLQTIQKKKFIYYYICCGSQIQSLTISFQMPHNTNYIFFMIDTTIVSYRNKNYFQLIDQVKFSVYCKNQVMFLSSMVPDLKLLMMLVQHTTRILYRATQEPEAKGIEQTRLWTTTDMNN